MMNEMIYQKRMRIRRKFRQIVRMVIANHYWLSDTEEKNIGENVQKNVTMIIKRNKASILGLPDKAILRKKFELRTEEENKILYKAIGNLKCFRKWPDDVKYKLVCRTHFLYFEEGRTIVKQNRVAEALYFIISGQVNIFIEFIDEVTGQLVVKQVSTLGSGAMFGEISLLENIPRTATIITASDCEFIVVSRKDFEETLHSTLKKLWDEIKLGLSYFPYFRKLTENNKIECCLISTINDYKTNEIIFDYAKKPPQKTAWFILEGSCNIIELIYVEEIKKKYSTEYKLYEDENLNVRRQTIMSIRKSKLKARQSNLNAKRISQDTRKSIQSVRKSIQLQDNDDQIKEDSDNESDDINTLRIESLYNLKEQIKSDVAVQCPVIKSLLNQSAYDLISSKNRSVSQIIAGLPKNVKPHLLQICTLHKRGCFFDNDLLTGRCVVSQGPVRLLLIPIYWLNIHNFAAIWPRIEKYMERTIPNKQQAFEIYLKQQKWKQDRETIRNQHIKIFRSSNTMRDIPYSLN